MSSKKNKRQNPEGDAHPKVTSIQDMYLSPKRQCTAHSKHTGEQCRRFAMRGLRVCVVHGGATRQAKAKAAQRIQEASGYAADLLVELMANPDIDVKTRTQIAQDLLNRSGVSEKHILELQPKAMSPFERAVLTAYVNEDGNPAFVDDGEGGMKAVNPGGGISSDVIMDLNVVDDPNIWDAEVVIDDDTTPLVPREEQSRHDRAVFREVERARRSTPQGDSRTRAEMIAAEEEALGVAAARPARQRATGRSNDDTAMRSQQDREDDEVRRVREAERRLNAERKWRAASAQHRGHHEPAEPTETAMSNLDRVRKRWQFGIAIERLLIEADDPDLWLEAEIYARRLFDLVTERNGNGTEPHRDAPPGEDIPP
ncbi:hypothetical protein [Microbacterium sp. USHLN186]|uniref:hypothetical protein n=1 Tax=Microbacterium sp. USHLN186 TaxID=3081286 RepID=UPI0030165921